MAVNAPQHNPNWPGVWTQDLENRFTAACVPLGVDINNCTIKQREAYLAAPELQRKCLHAIVASLGWGSPAELPTDVSAAVMQHLVSEAIHRPDQVSQLLTDFSDLQNEQMRAETNLINLNNRLKRFDPSQVRHTIWSMPWTRSANELKALNDIKYAKSIAEAATRQLTANLDTARQGLVADILRIPDCKNALVAAALGRVTKSPAEKREEMLQKAEDTLGSLGEAGDTLRNNIENAERHEWVEQTYKAVRSGVLEAKTEHGVKKYNPQSAEASLIKVFRSTKDEHQANWIEQTLHILMNSAQNQGDAMVIQGLLAAYSAAADRKYPNRALNAASRVKQDEVAALLTQAQAQAAPVQAQAPAAAQAPAVAPDLNDQLTLAIDQINQISAKLTELEGRLDQSETANARLVTELSSAQANLTNATSLIAQLNAKIAALQAENDILKNSSAPNPATPTEPDPTAATFEFDDDDFADAEENTDPGATSGDTATTPTPDTTPAPATSPDADAAAATGEPDDASSGPNADAGGNTEPVAASGGPAAAPTPDTTPAPATQSDAEPEEESLESGAPEATTTHSQASESATTPAATPAAEPAPKVDLDNPRSPAEFIAVFEQGRGRERFKTLTAARYSDTRFIGDLTRALQNSLNKKGISEEKQKDLRIMLSILKNEIPIDNWLGALETSASAGQVPDPEIVQSLFEKVSESGSAKRYIERISRSLESRFTGNQMIVALIELARNKNSDLLESAGSTFSMILDTASDLLGKLDARADNTESLRTLEAILARLSGTIQSLKAKGANTSELETKLAEFQARLEAAKNAQAIATESLAAMIAAQSTDEDEMTALGAALKQAAAAKQTPK